MPLATAEARAFGAATFIAGGVLALIAAVTFKRAGTNVVPNKPATALVTSGLFAQSRNPGYIGQTLMYAGLAIAFRSTSAIAALAPLLAIIDRAVVAREERYLLSKFGHAYRVYADRAPRWF